MMERTLTLLEITGIQPYIFGSNQLAQNIGASELVARATTRKVVDTLQELQWSSNIYWKDDDTIFGPGVQYNTNSLGDNLRVEVVYAGGGNAMLLFREMQDARNFIRKLTRYLVENAPGLRLVAAHSTYNHATNILSDVHHALRGTLAHRKHDHAVSAPLLGLGVTATCVYTGLPAIGFDDDERIVGRDAVEKIQQYSGAYQHRHIAAEVAAKLKAERAGKRRLDSVLPQVKGDFGYDFIYDFDEIGDHDESSYIAVVHADGNRMGERFDEIRHANTSANKNDDYIKALRDFSLKIRRRAKRALSETVDYLFASLDSGDGNGRFGGVVRTPRNRSGDPVLPFRPIVFGGDDITFVCDGRLGLDLAAYYLKAFCREDDPDERLVGGPVSARAGVAVVKTHYPFSRAYDLAEELARQAKSAISTFNPQKKQSMVIDWHFATTGMLFPIAEIRKKEYQDNKDRSLLMRPVTLDTNATTWRTWKTFRSLVDTFQHGGQNDDDHDDNGNKWQGMRNKVLALREALREGETAVELFLAMHSQVDELPTIEGKPDMALRGWQAGECGYFDAIEAIDFFVSLELVEAATK